MTEEKRVSAWVLVAANLVPPAGVLFWDWSVFALIALFWMECVLSGVIIVLQILCVRPRDPLLWLGKLFMLPIFGLLYGVPIALYGNLVLAMFGGRRYYAHNVEPINFDAGYVLAMGRVAADFGLELLLGAARVAADFDLWPALAALAASHLFSFAWNGLHRGELRRATLAGLVSKPLLRLLVLHLVTVVGGIASLLLGSPLWALLLLIALKIGLDVKAHVKEHSGP